MIRETTSSVQPTSGKCVKTIYACACSRAISCLKVLNMVKPARLSIQGTETTIKSARRRRKSSRSSSLTYRGEGEDVEMALLPRPHSTGEWRPKVFSYKQQDVELVSRTVEPRGCLQDIVCAVLRPSCRRVNCERLWRSEVEMVVLFKPIRGVGLVVSVMTNCCPSAEAATSTS